MNKKNVNLHFIGFIVLITTLLSGIFSWVDAQLIKAEVVLHTERLPIEEREYLEMLNQELITVINSSTWIERGLPYTLPIRIEIFFEKHGRSATYHTYTAGVMVATQSGVQLRDNRWDFRYSRDFRLHIGDPYDPLTGLLECFISLCIGFELDKLSPLGGQAYYDKAKLIAEKARFEIDYYRGWDDRRKFITDLTLDEYREIRTASFHAAAGIFYANKGKLESARSHLTRTATILLKIKPKLMNLKRDGNLIRFINVQEFSSALKKVEAFDALKNLAQWDPDNAEIYLSQ